MTGAPRVVARQRVRNLLRPPVRLLERTLVDVGRLTGGQGSLPHFLVLGAQKAGTTSLYDLLIQHPDIQSARTKEIGYFDRFYGRGEGWYRANFPQCDEGQITGEATPDYLYLDEARLRIVEDLPSETKFIVLLRHPADRALSHYFHAVHRGYETLDLESALAAETDRITQTGHDPAGSTLERRTRNSAFSYFARGLYADQLRKWFADISSERFYIQTADRFFADPGAVVNEISHFLGVSAFAPPQAARRNVGTYSDRLDQAVYRTLRESYRESVGDLEDLLGRRLGWQDLSRNT